MEFSCRLVTARGEIVEGVYVADSEARLRHELEEKGLYVLSLQPRGGHRRLLASACRGAGGSARGSSSSSTRNWRRCSRPACRWCSRSTSCGAASRTRCSGGARRRPREGARPARRCRTRSRRTATCFRASTPPRCWPASAAATSTRCCADYVEYTKIIATVRRKTISALIYPAILIALALVAGRRSSC